jgi:hypothetical protein
LIGEAFARPEKIIAAVSAPVRRRKSALTHVVLRFDLDPTAGVDAPAGGSWSCGTGGEEIVMDAANFCRILSGRPGLDGSQPWGLLTTQVPF